MHIALIVIAILIIAGGRAYQERVKVNVSENTQPRQTTTIQPTADLTPTSLPTPTLTSRLTPTATSMPTAKSTPAIPNKWWNYPNKARENIIANKKEVWTNDSADKVADWYEGRIKEFGGRNQTIIRTKTNGKAKIVIAVFVNNAKTDIVIDQENGGAQTLITITLSIDTN